MSKPEIGTIASVITAVVAIVTLIVAYGNFNNRLAKVERRIDTLPILTRAQSVLGDLGDNRCEWQPMVRAQQDGHQECPEGYYVKGIGFHYESGLRRPYPMRYRLYCCALTS